MGILREEEWDRIRVSAGMASEILEEMGLLVREGASTRQIDQAAEDGIFQRGATPAFKGYRGYPSTTCISVNEVVVHGIPSDDRALRHGDVVSIDVGLCYNGYFGDVAYTFCVGQVDETVQRLLDVTKASLQRGSAKAVPGGRLGDISHAIQKTVERAGFSVIRDFVGHGIGKKLHEDPQVPNFGKARRGPVLEPGMVLAIEPMTACGRREVEIAGDGWTASTRDGSVAAHFEHMVLIKETGFEVITTHPAHLTAGACDASL